jgi:hypothetical protein
MNRFSIFLSSLLFFVIGLSIDIYAEDGGTCCTVSIEEIDELPNPSKQVYAVRIPNADYKFSSKIARSNLRRLSSQKVSREQTLYTTERFFWSNPINDTSKIFLLILPEGEGTIIYGLLKTETQSWVEPNSGSQALLFANYLKELGESIHGEIIDGNLKELQRERKKLQRRVKKHNRAIKKLRKQITKSNSRIASAREELSMLKAEQELLIRDIADKRERMEDLRKEDKAAFKALRKEKKKKAKLLNKNKKAQEKLQKKILDYQENISKHEADISRIREERQEVEEDILRLRESRRGLREQRN